MLPQPVKEYLETLSKPDKGKVLRVIADLTQENSFEKAVETISTALSYGVTDIDSLINLHNRLHEKIPQLKPVSLPEHIPHLRRYEPNFMIYDKILERQVQRDASS